MGVEDGIGGEEIRSCAVRAVVLPLLPRATCPPPDSSPAHRAWKRIVDGNEREAHRVVYADVDGQAWAESAAGDRRRGCDGRVPVLVCKYKSLLDIKKGKGVRQ
jgi:hypothetical protein